MRVITIILMSLLLPLCIQSQTITNLFNFGGSNSDNIKAFCRDDLGNIYILGQTSGWLYYDDLSLPSPPNTISYTFILKVDADGNYIWHQNLKYYSQLEKSPLKMVVDADYNIYITDYYTGTADVQGQIFEPYEGSTTGFLTAKFNPLGELIWVNQGGGESLHLAEDGTITIFTYYSPDDLWDPNNGINYEGMVYTFDNDGNYISHIHVNDPNYVGEVLHDVNTSGNYFGIRKTTSFNSDSQIELFEVNTTGELIQSKIINHNNGAFFPGPVVQDPATGHYYVHGRFFNREPLDAPEGTEAHCMMLLHLDESFNLLHKLQLSPEQTANSGTANFFLVPDNGYIYLSAVMDTYPIFIWSSLGQENYIEAIDSQPVIAKLTTDLEVEWYRYFPTTYFNNRIFPINFNDEVNFIGCMGSASIDDEDLDVLGPVDFVIIRVDDLDSTAAYVNGLIFIDSNNNGLRDAGELNATQNISVINSVYAEYSVTSDLNGEFSLPANLGIQDIVGGALPSNWIYTTPNFQTIDIAFINQSTDTIYFGIAPAAAVNDLSISLNATNDAIAGNNVGFVIDLCNDGGIEGSGTMLFIPDTSFTYVSSEPAPIAVGDTLYYDVSSLQPGECMSFWITCNYDPEIDSQQNAFAHHAEIVTEQADVSPENNHDELYQQLNYNSVNHLTVEPSCTMGQSAVIAGNPLSYTISFQNTGTAIVHDVTIYCPVSPALDPTSFDIIGASGNAICNVEGSLFQITMNDLDLSPANTDPENSGGYVQFTFIPYDNLQPSDIIEMQAEILYDFNLPISTNVVATEITETSVEIGLSITPAACPNTQDATIELTNYCSDALYYYTINEEPLSALQNGVIEGLSQGTYQIGIFQGSNIILDETITIDAIEGPSVSLVNVFPACGNLSNGSFEVAYTCTELPYTISINGDTPFITFVPYFGNLPAGDYDITLITSTSSYELQNIIVESVNIGDFTELVIQEPLCPSDTVGITAENTCFIEGIECSCSIDGGDIFPIYIGEPFNAPTGNHTLTIYFDGDLINEIDYSAANPEDINIGIEAEGLTVEITEPIAGSQYTWFDCNSGEIFQTSSEASYTADTITGSLLVGVIINTPEGCTYRSDCVELLVGIGETFSAHQIMIYPNPSNGILTIQKREGTRPMLLVHDMAGKLILKQQLSANKFDIIELTQKGAYQFTIQSAEGHEVKQVIVE
jgi:hypothetical protein